jgi:uncharacterized alkaline shock family protein YloU
MTTAKSNVSAPTQKGQSAPSPTDAAPVAQRPGKVEVSAHAIAAIAAQATTECYGVYGLASRRLRLGEVQRLAADARTRGVDVRFVDDHVVIDVWVILEHSLRVIEVAHNIMVIVKYAVEQALGLQVAQVNVNVQALHVRE